MNALLGRLGNLVAPWMKIIQLVAVLLGIALIIWSYIHTYNAGGRHERAKVEKQVAARTAAVQKQADEAAKRYEQEIAALGAYRGASDLGPVRVCVNRIVRAQPGATASSEGPGAPAAGVQPVPAGDSGIRPGADTPDIAPLLDALAARADSVSAQLRVYQSVTP